MKLFRKLSILLVASLALFGAYQIGRFFFEEKVAEAKAKPEIIKNYKIEIEDEDFKKVKEIQFISGYKREYNFTYIPDKDDYAFEDTKDDNWLKAAVNWYDKSLREKTLSFDARSITMFGYDTQYLKKEDITYNPSNKTLYIHPPHLQMIIMLEFNNLKFKEGAWTYLFDRFKPEEIEAFQDNARKQVELKYLNNKEIELGYELTNKAFKEMILNKQFSFEVEKIVFEKNTEEIEIINKELDGK